jgi:hypothetical protein
MMYMLNKFKSFLKDTFLLHDVVGEIIHPELAS